MVVNDAFAQAGLDPVAGALQAAAAHKLLPTGVSIEDAVRDFMARREAGIVPRTVPELTADLLAKKKVGPEWKRILAHMLEVFAERFRDFPDTIPARDIEDTLDALPVGPRTRRNYRAAWAEVFTFAVRRGHLPKDFDVMEAVSDPDPPPANPDPYTPDEMVRLLTYADSFKAGRRMVPLIAIEGFGGVRHAEIKRLHWQDFDWETKTIYVSKTIAKTGRDRVVDIRDNLALWLEPYRRPSGKVCELVNASCSLCRLCAGAAIPAKRNGLRQAFITYSLAASRNIDAVADQAGNSPAVIRSNYNSPSTRRRAEAERYFGITPQRADVLPLFTWAQARA